MVKGIYFTGLAEITQNLRCLLCALWSMLLLEFKNLLLWHFIFIMCFLTILFLTLLVLTYYLFKGVYLCRVSNAISLNYLNSLVSRLSRKTSLSNFWYLWYLMMFGCWKLEWTATEIVGRRKYSSLTIIIKSMHNILCPFLKQVISLKIFWQPNIWQT